jgi:hypothetical protein
MNWNAANRVVHSIAHLQRMSWQYFSTFCIPALNSAWLKPGIKCCGHTWLIALGTTRTWGPSDEYGQYQFIDHSPISQYVAV